MPAGVVVAAKVLLCKDCTSESFEIKGRQLAGLFYVVMLHVFCY